MDQQSGIDTEDKLLRAPCYLMWVTMQTVLFWGLHVVEGFSDERHHPYHYTRMRRSSNTSIKENKQIISLL